MTFYPTSLAYRLLTLAPYWLLLGAAAATFLYRRRGGWFGIGWTLLLWILGPAGWLLVALEIATTRPPGRRIR